LTQPTVSAHIRILEDALGTRLFDRQRHGARLTDAGQVVYRYALDVLQQTNSLHARLSAVAGGLEHTITLGVGMTWSTYVVPSLIASFHQQHPAVQIRVRILSPAAIGQQVLAGQLDFGWVGEATLRPTALHAEPLWQEPKVLVAPPDHRLARKPRVSVADVAGEAFIGCPTPSAVERALDAELTAQGLPPRRLVIEAGHPDGVKRAVQERAGLAVLYRAAVAEELRRQQLVALALSDVPMKEQLSLIYRPGQNHMPAVERLIAFIQDAGRRVARDGEYQSTS
jgi:DNA-binding transcriptional LysR family regulator